MKPTSSSSMASEDVVAHVDSTTRAASSHNSTDRVSDVDMVAAVNAEILRTVAAGSSHRGMDRPEWTSSSSSNAPVANSVLVSTVAHQSTANVTDTCSSPFKCYTTSVKSSPLTTSGTDTFRRARRGQPEIFIPAIDKNFNTTTAYDINMMSSSNNNQSPSSIMSPPIVRRIENGSDSRFAAQNGTASTPTRSVVSSGATSPQKATSATTTSSATPKKTPVKLMRTPSNTIIRKRSSSSHSNGDGKRLDEELEELDAHLMSTTLKNVKFMHGPKFTVFNDIAFQRECLESHNKTRLLYGCPPVNWCQELADQAETWAQAVAERGRILYKELPGIGENISLLSANGSNHLPTGNEVSELWASEVQHYNFSKPGWSGKCQHFTQMIWKSTADFGVGRVWIPSKSLVAIVAFYSPSGNCNGINEFRDNVPKPLGDGPPNLNLSKK